MRWLPLKIKQTQSIKVVNQKYLQPSVTISPFYSEVAAATRPDVILELRAALNKTMTPNYFLRAKGRMASSSLLLYMPV